MWKVKREQEQSKQQDECKTTSSEDDQYFEVNSTEMQSLTTTLSLLRNYIVGGNNRFKSGGNTVKISDWKALKLGIEDLQVLEDSHSDKIVSLVAGRIKQVIAKHVTVMEYNQQVIA